MNATDDDVALGRRLVGIINGGWMSQAAYAAVKLGIPDRLQQCPQNSAELAATTGSDADALRQLLRALSALGICAERNDDRFEITPLGRLLATDAPLSLRSWTLAWGGYQLPLWSHLAESVRSGRSARSMLRGTEGFEHLERDPEYAEIFNTAMVELTRLVAAEVVRVYDFSGKRVIDVGGGYGELLAAILETYPDASGVLFDMPHALDEARRRLAVRRLDGRCELVTGDFFESVPRGADVYLLKSVIHDWNDERASAILATCRRAIAPDARLVLVERVVPERLDATPEHQAIAQSDLNMLVALGARERTLGELDRLFGAAGFERVRCLRAGPAFSVLEARPV